MNDIDCLRNKVKEYYGKDLIIKQNIGRNKVLKYEGTITDIYSNLFIFKTEHETKSFSYSDLLIKNIIIKIK